MQIIIGVKKSNMAYLKQIFDFKYLIWILASRDIKTQYSQTRYGLILAFLKAIISAILFQLFFGYVLKVDVPIMPYIVYVFPGLMLWYYFSHIVSFASVSLIQSQVLIQKVFFPKIILLFSKSIVGLVDLFIWLIIYVIILFYYNVTVRFTILLLPISILFTMINGLAISIWLSSLTIKNRDAVHIIPFIIGFGIFVTPVFFSFNALPEQYQFIQYFNPMSGAIMFFRWCVFGIDFSWMHFLGQLISVFIFVPGLIYFKKIEGVISDVI